MVHSQDARQDVSFSSFPFLDTIFRDLEAAGFQRPTPIQAACIPHALAGKDMIGLAQTGTGKTAAFALPIIHRLARRAELGALVLAPTRELAAQITVMFNQLGRSSGIRVATIVGGMPMDGDRKALASWPNVLVATPGRLIDHIWSNTVYLKEIEVLVVDEADRMHDMGFIPQVRRIMIELPKERQTLMFTATMPRDVERIVRQSMRDPVRVQVGPPSMPVQGARQQLFEVSESGKPALLAHLLENDGRGRALVFLRTKRGVDALARALPHRFNSARIHGDREQSDRDAAMRGFREGRYRVLIATDIAARGIDVADIEHVINYDFPHEAEDYIHRIGRTARLAAEGLASSFVTRNDWRYVEQVRRLIGDKLPQPVPSPLGATPEAQPDQHKRREGHAARAGDAAGTGQGRGGGRRRRGRPAASSGAGRGHGGHHVAASAPATAPKGQPGGLSV